MGIVRIKSFRLRYGINCTFISLLLVGLVLIPLASLIAPVYAVTILTLKWQRSTGLTNWEGGMVVGDVDNDGYEEIVFAGESNSVLVLNATSGATKYSYTNSRISQYCQPQMGDINNDGRLEILVPLYYQPGLAVLRVNNQNTALDELWYKNVQGTSDPLGSVMSKPIPADINGDGYMEIFVPSQDVEPQGGFDGTLTLFDYLGNQLANQTFSWRSCSGGVSLADTDKDGEFELYMGDRDEYMGDGGYGKGCRSFWARNLTQRWNNPTFLCSSQAPVLADVTGDGILEVVVSDQRGGIHVLNSTTGAFIKANFGQGLPVHYQLTVYDIDGDGHLEALCCDGDHSHAMQGSNSSGYPNEMYVFDLVTSQVDSIISLGGPVPSNPALNQSWISKFSPTIANIYENGNNAYGPNMEIIVGPNRADNQTASLLIFDNNYNLLQNVTGLGGSQIAYSSVQDIDNNGFLEVIIDNSAGNIRAYNTTMPKPAERIRSEVSFFSELRAGAAVFVPKPWNLSQAPLVAPVYPRNDGLAVPTSLSQLSFNLTDRQGDLMNYWVTSSPNIGSGSGSGHNGAYNVPVVGGPLQPYSTYTWTVNAKDASQWTNRTYTFKTAFAAPSGNAPTHGVPTISSLNGTNECISTFVCYNQTTYDNEGDAVTNLYNWYLNGTSATNVLMPFNTRNDTSVKDYSGNNNAGAIYGATWVPNGISGGAYSFDGYNDYIAISDGGKGYYNNHTDAQNAAEGYGYPAYHPSLLADGTRTEITLEHWIYLAANTGTDGSVRTIAKTPSYEIGFRRSATQNLLFGRIWYWILDNTTATVKFTQNSDWTVNSATPLATATWYHVVLTYKSFEGIKLYINGQLNAQRLSTPTSPVNGTVMRSSGEPVILGGGLGNFKGMIDEVRIYPRALTTEQITNRYLESKNGLTNSSLAMPFGLGSTGGTIQCEVTPSDSQRDGQSRLSNTITLVNSAPIASNLKIGPRVRNLALDTEALLGSYVYYDYSGNPESGTEIRWYKNSTLQTGLNNTLTVPASSTSVNDLWYFTVRPKDGSLFGDIQTSYTLTVVPNVSPTQTTPFLNSSFGTNRADEDLIARNQTTADSGGNDVTNIYNYFKNGVSMTNLLMPFDTETYIDPSVNYTTRDYSGYGNNGTVVGATWNESGIVGGAYSFDGTDFIRINEAGNTLGGDGSWSQISVEFWIRATGATTSIQTVVFKPNASYAPGASSSSYSVGYRVQYRYYADSYRVYWIVGNSTATLSFDSRVYEGPDQWHHVVCTYQSGVGLGLKIYTDGQLRASLNGTGNINATLGGPLYVGGINSGVGDFVGQMDEARIYPKALSAAQIFQRYIDSRNGLTSNFTLAAEEISVGDAWKCQVIPNNSFFDGSALNSTTRNIVAPDQRPRIDLFSPADALVSVNEGGSINFTQVSSDPNGDPLTYNWTLDSVQKAVTQNWTYLSAIAGMHTVRITVYDGSLSDAQEWSVNVTPNGTYNLVIGASAGGTTNPVPNTYPYPANTNVTVTAIPTAGYKLNYWLLNNSNYGSANPYTINMTNNYNLTAAFAIIQYNLVVGSTTGGTTNPVPGTYQYNANTNATVQAIPNANYRLNYWLLNGSNYGSANPCAVNMTADFNLTAVFIRQYNLIVGASGNGNTNPIPGTYAYDEKTNATVQAIPNGGFELGYWLLDDVDVGDTSPYRVTMNTNHNLTAVFVVPPANAYLVVRGADDSVWYRSFDGSSWSGWIGVGGQTYDTPAAAVLNGKLHIIVNGTDGGLWWGVVDLSDNSFSGWQGISGHGTPTMMATGNEIYLVVRGTDNVIWYRSYDGSVWSGWIGLGGLTYDTPAAAVLNGRLHIVVNGTDGALWWSSVNLTDNSFSGWQGISGYGTPTMTAIDSEVYLVVRGTDNGIWYRSYDGSTWTNWIGLGGQTYDTPAATVLNGRLHIVVNGTDGSLWWSSVNLTDNSFSGWQGISGKGTPTLTCRSYS